MVGTWSLTPITEAKGSGPSSSSPSTGVIFAVGGGGGGLASGTLELTHFSHHFLVLQPSHHVGILSLASHLIPMLFK